MKSCCFTGHRSIPETKQESLLSRLYEMLERGISKGIVDYYVDGAIGWDTLCARVVIELKKKYDTAQLHLVLPCSNAKQTAKWSDEQRREFYEILAVADSVEYVSERYYNGCMRDRNARLVERADVCLCYLDTSKARSGTSQTVRMAVQKGIRVYNFYSGNGG